MTLSRKAFFRQGLFSLGETLLKVGGTVLEVPSNTPGGDADPEREPVPDLDSVAFVDNRSCLAGKCGCFSCLERCDAGAISLVAGEGIRIDQALCSGCGTCEYVCPVTPKALRMISRNRIQVH